MQVNVYDASSGGRVVQYSSEHMTAVASRYCIHPTQPKLVASTSSGRVHIYSK